MPIFLSLFKEVQVVPGHCFIYKGRTIEILTQKVEILSQQVAITSQLVGKNVSSWHVLSLESK